jgi:hypothetical protein
MKAVRHRNPRAGYIRILRTSDLDALGIKHKGQDLVWNQDNNFTIVMNNQMSDSLVERLPTEFIAMDAEEADEASEVPDPMTSLASSLPEASESDPESSEASGDDDVQRSTRKRSKNQ